MSRKRTWSIKLGKLPVVWYCLHRTERREYKAEEPFARFVVLQAATEDGRPLALALTPNEARRIGRQLASRADFVDDCNRRQNNGWAEDADPTAIVSF